MNKFKHTYINVSELTPEEIDALAKKYAEATGLPLEMYLQEVGALTPWVYLGSVVSKDEDARNPLECICVTEELECFVEHVTEITEAALDDYLVGLTTPATPKMVSFDFPDTTSTGYPDFGFKINLEMLTDDEKELAKEWLISNMKAEGGSVVYITGKYSHLVFIWVERNLYDYKTASTVEKGFDSMEYASGFDSINLPEITLTFSKPAVTGFIVNNSKKVLQLETEINTLRSQLEAKEAELNNLK